MKLLITGVPATRKTTVGDYLKDRYGFLHLNYEDLTAREPQLLNQAKRSIVITWGFMPGTDDTTIRELQRAGFKLIWFDGNRKSARREFIKRNKQRQEMGIAPIPLELLDIQMDRINSMNINSLDATVINTFDDRGNLLPMGDIIKSLGIG